MIRIFISIILISLISQYVLAYELSDVPSLQSNSAPETYSNMAYFPDRENYFYISGGIIPTQILGGTSNTIGGSLHLGYGHTSKYVGMEVLAIGEYISCSGGPLVNFSIATLLLLKVPIEVDYRIRITPLLGVGPAVNIGSMGILPAVYAKAGLRVEFYRYFVGANFSVLPMFWIAYPIPSVNIEAGIKF